MKPVLRQTVTFLVILLIAGCAASRPTSYVDPQFDFSGVERVAVLPFENLAADQSVARYVTRVFMTELLAQQVFEIVEPGEVSAWLAKKSITSYSELTIDQIHDLGKTLNVQGIIMGSVGEAGELRSGSVNTNIVSLSTRMVSVETGGTIWSSTVNTSGPGFFSRLFGVGERSKSAATRIAVRKTIHTLVR